jgi:hypothetical protein
MAISTITCNILIFWNFPSNKIVIRGLGYRSKMKKWSAGAVRGRMFEGTTLVN